MEITDVQVKVYSCASPSTMKFWGGWLPHFKRDVQIAKISTDEGVVGFGEYIGFPMMFSADVLSDTWRSYDIYDSYERYTRHGKMLDPRHITAIAKKIGDQIIGEDSTNIEGIWAKASELINDEGILTVVMSGIDIALHDIIGKASGKRICDLLGRKRDRIKVYASGGLWRSVDRYVKEVTQRMEEGFKAWKFRIGLGPQKDIKLIEAVRDAVGDDFDLMVDCNSFWVFTPGLSYSRQAMRNLAEELIKLNIQFMEEPFSPLDLPLFRDLKAEYPDLKLAAGERMMTAPSIEMLLKETNIDYVQWGVQNGGFTTGMKVIQKVREYSKKLVPYTWQTSLTQITNAQLLASLTEEEAPWAEFPVWETDVKLGAFPFPIAMDILTEPLEVKDGYLELPRKPGLGVDVDEKILEKKYSTYIAGPGVQTPILVVPTS